MSTSIEQPLHVHFSGLDLFKTLSIVVDDKEEDLYAILWGLQSAGLACVPLRYDALTGLQNSTINELPTARLVFLDLNLERAPTRGSSDQATHISTVLRELRLRGPYILIVWSDFKANLDNVLKTAFERTPEVVLPVGIAVLHKEKFLVGGVEGEYDFQALGEHISQIVAQYPQVFAMMAWESRTATAASTVTQNLFELKEPVDSSTVSSLLAKLQKEVEAMPPDASAPVISKPLYPKDRISKIFHSIGTAACGKHTDEDPSAAIDAGLLPLLEDKFLSIPTDSACCQTWQSVFNEKGAGKLEAPVVCKLNSYLLIDKLEGTFSHRGLFLELNDTPENTFLSSYLGENREALQRHFFDKGKIKNLTANGQAARANEIISTCKIGMLECSAACDHAQNNIGVRLGLLAALVPEGSANQITSAESFYHEGEGLKIHFGDKNYILIVSYKYPVGLPQHLIENRTYFSPLFRAREQLLNSISVRFSAYASRPGVISVFEK
ncbi:MULTISPECIES: hypothetical protein [unclassified Desulfovibrio]|uniref:hypothetical protein n=1 Tax=unclassified Desulfovibrio TaxID=2593640 RepID=UPI002FDB29F6